MLSSFAKSSLKVDIARNQDSLKNVMEQLSSQSDKNKNINNNIANLTKNVDHSIEELNSNVISLQVSS